MDHKELSKEELEKLRQIWDADLEAFPEDEPYSDISNVIKSDVIQTLHLTIPEKKEDQEKALAELSGAFEFYLKDSYKPLNNVFRDSENNLKEVVNDPKTIKALGDKVRAVVNFIIDEFSRHIRDLENGEAGAQEALDSFRKNVLGSVQMGLETAKSMTQDFTPVEIKVLETLFNALKIPYSPADVVEMFSEKDQEKTYKLAFKTEEEDLGKEAIDNMFRARAILTKCKEEEADKGSIKTAEDNLAYWQSMAQAEPFPGEQKKKLDEYYRFKTQLRNFDLMMSKKISYKQMLELYEKLKPKTKKKNDGEIAA